MSENSEKHPPDGRTVNYRKIRFLPQWAEKDARFSVFVSVKDNSYAAFCVVCSKIINTSSGGKSLLSQHLNTKKHRKNSEITELREQHNVYADSDDPGESTSHILPPESSGTQKEPTEYPETDGEIAPEHGKKFLRVALTKLPPGRYAFASRSPNWKETTSYFLSESPGTQKEAAEVPVTDSEIEIIHTSVSKNTAVVAMPGEDGPSTFQDTVLTTEECAPLDSQHQSFESCEELDGEFTMDDKTEIYRKMFWKIWNPVSENLENASVDTMPGEDNPSAFQDTVLTTEECAPLDPQHQSSENFKESDGEFTMDGEIDKYYVFNSDNIQTNSTHLYEKNAVTIGIMEEENEESADSAFSCIENQPPSETMDSNSSKSLVILSESESKYDIKTILTLNNEQNSSTCHKSEYINSFQNEEVHHSEILRSLFCVKHNLSYATYNAAELKKMFPGYFTHLMLTCDPDRLEHIVHHGLKPYFRKKLLNMLQKAEYCVLVFKEIFYGIPQDKQIDIYIRFWNTDSNTVQMRYLNSLFIRFDTEAADVAESIRGCLDSLKNCWIIQLCLDGSGDSLRYLEDLQCKIDKDFGYGIVDLNNSLHSIYEAFERGEEATGWKLGDILRNLYLIFKDSPERCTQYVKKTGCHEFPLPFHSQWLLLNIQTAERACEIWFNIKKYLHDFCTKYPSMSKTNCFATVREACDDDLMPIKLKFFISVGQRMEIIVNLFKSEKPMLPFFCKELKKLEDTFNNYYLMGRYSDPRTVNKSDEYQSSEITHRFLALHLGFSAENLYNQISDLVNPTEKRDLKASAVQMILKIKEEINNIFLLNKPLFKCLACLDPACMINDSVNCKHKFFYVLRTFMDANHLPENVCEELEVQYSAFLCDIHSHHRSDFEKFNPEADDSRVDTFLNHYLSGLKYEKLRHFVNELMILFNGQVESKRFFARNDESKGEHLYADYRARRFISDHIMNTDTNVTYKLLQKVTEALWT